ncbi:MAG: ATP-dependent RecD-like DNA helicase [Flavobacteriales bacterium]
MSAVTQIDAFVDRCRSVFQFPLTNDQIAALQQFAQFWFAEQHRKVWVLTGFAGTGKSTLIAGLTQLLRIEKINFKLLAPTGRAAKVLANYADRPASTIHRQIYFSGGELAQKGLTKARNLHKNTLFFVDEASMLADTDTMEADNLLEDLLNYVYTGENCHLVLIGDPGQLPPVGQQHSIALKPQLLLERYPSLTVYHAQLNQVVRVGEDSAILACATKLRSLEQFQLPLFEPLQSKQVLRIHGGDFQEYLESSYSAVGTDESILLTMSNKRANQWNREIRNRLFFREEVLEKGDLLMVVKNNYFWLDPNSKMGFIANGELAKIDRVRRFEANYGFEFAYVDLRFVDYPDQSPISCWVHLSSLAEEAPSLQRETLRKLFYAIEATHQDIKNKQKRYQEVLKNPFFNALQIKYAHAITVHKAQGGQWAHVYIDYGFLPEERKNDQYLRWLYTSVTRASEQLYLLNFPDDYFQGASD